MNDEDQTETEVDDAGEGEDVAIIELTAELYFEGQPDLTAEALNEAWSKEGYDCEASEPVKDNIVAVARGATFNILKAFTPIDHADVPKGYPAVARTNLPYDQTYLIDHAKAYADFQRCTHKTKLIFRVMASDGPFVAANELVVSLLGIQQVQPIMAMRLDHAGILVGAGDIDEHTSYVNSHLEEEPSTPYSLLFGVLVEHEGARVRAWSRGFSHFGQRELFIEEDSLEPMSAAQLLFNSGCQVVDGHRFHADETMETGSLFCSIQGATFEGEPALRLVPR